MVFTKNKLEWRMLECLENDIKRIVEITGLSELLAKILCHAGIHQRKKQEIKRFLSPAKSLLSETQRLSAESDLKAALLRLETAIKNKESVIVHGDSDADGITATTILVVALRCFGLKVYHDFPIRSQEGHGVQIRIIEEALKKKCSLMLTADSGTKDVSAIAYAQEKGLDVIVTDHHLLGFERPNACAIINPLLYGKETPDFFLCGAGVALKLMIATSKYVKQSFPKKTYRFLLAMAALGTISDRMTFLEPQNRALVYFGMKEFNELDFPGVKALRMLAAQGSDRVFARDVGRTISPRLNAPGRIGDPAKGIPDSNLVVELLSYGVVNPSEKKEDKKLKQYIKDFMFVFDSDKKQAKPVDSLQVTQKAEMVDEVNEERKKITEKIAIDIEAIIQKSGGFESDRIILICGKDWNSGVIGIDTDRIRDRFKKPAIIMTKYTGSDYLKASCRSIPNVNMYAVIESIQKTFMQDKGRDPFVCAADSTEGSKLVNSFGGHAQACGFSMANEDLPYFSQLLNQEAQKLSPDQFLFQLPIAEDINFEQLNLNFLKEFQSIAPFGEGFSFPNFRIKGVSLSKRMRPFGNKYQKERTPHVEFAIYDPKANRTLACVGYGLNDALAASIKEYGTKQKLDLVFSPEYAQTRGKGKKKTTYLRLNVIDFKLAGA